jgi:hypothetical protein
MSSHFNLPILSDYCPYIIPSHLIPYALFLVPLLISPSLPSHLSSCLSLYFLPLNSTSQNSPHYFIVISSAFLLCFSSSLPSFSSSSSHLCFLTSFFSLNIVHFLSICPPFIPPRLSPLALFPFSSSFLLRFSYFLSRNFVYLHFSPSHLFPYTLPRLAFFPIFFIYILSSPFLNLPLYVPPVSPPLIPPHLSALSLYLARCTVTVHSNSYCRYLFKLPNSNLR